MGLTVCPAAVVAAPVESVWELLSEPTLYDVWWDARTERIVPEGKAAPGQPDKHQIQLHVTLPPGTVNETTITCTAIDTASCRVQFG